MHEFCICGHSRVAHQRGVALAGCAVTGCGCSGFEPADPPIAVETLLHEERKWSQWLEHHVQTTNEADSIRRILKALQETADAVLAHERAGYDRPG